MKIVIDCRWIFPQISGIGCYTKNLIRGLAAVDKENEYFLISGRCPDADNFRSLPVAYGLYSLANQVKLPRLLKELRADVFHSPNFMIPLRVPRTTKVVITIHDMIPWKFPQYTPKAKKTRWQWLFRLIFRRAAARADKIISVSQNTARDIKDCLSVPVNKIEVVHNGIEERFFQAKAGERGLERSYILFIGRADPYKNLIGLLKAYAVLVRKYTVGNKLVVVGQPDDRYPEANYWVAKLGLEQRVIFYGYAAVEKLVEIYANAAVFVLPSFYEGFGLPPVEAMAVGVPVIVSNTPALAEVAGDCALQVDPQDTEGMAEAIYKVISDRELSAELVARGKEQAKKFTIETMAKDTLEVYKRCVLL